MRYQRCYIEHSGLFLKTFGVFRNIFWRFHSDRTFRSYLWPKMRQGKTYYRCSRPAEQAGTHRFCRGSLCSRLWYVHQSRAVILQQFRGSCGMHLLKRCWTRCRGNNGPATMIGYRHIQAHGRWRQLRLRERACRRDVGHSLNRFCSACFIRVRQPAA